MGIREYYFDPVAFPKSLICALKLQFVNIGIYLVLIIASVVSGAYGGQDPAQTLLIVFLTAVASVIFYLLRIYILRMRKAWPRLVFTAIIVIGDLRALVIFAGQPETLLQAKVLPLFIGCMLSIILDVVTIYLLFKRDVTDWVQRA